MVDHSQFTGLPGLFIMYYLHQIYETDSIFSELDRKKYFEKPRTFYLKSIDFSKTICTFDMSAMQTTTAVPEKLKQSRANNNYLIKMETVTKFNLSKIMKSAWNRMKNSFRATSFSECLKMAWKEAKELVIEVPSRCKERTCSTSQLSYLQSFSNVTIECTPSQLTKHLPIREASRAIEAALKGVLVRIF